MRTKISVLAGLLLLSLTLTSTRSGITVPSFSTLWGSVDSRKKKSASHKQNSPLNQPASHRVLSCDELLRRILDYLYEIDEESYSLDWECKDTLASLAVTCRSISEPALDVLWRCISDSEAFDAFLQATSILQDSHKSNNKPLHSVFSKYFHRIHGLHVMTDLWTEPLSQALQIQPQPVFPRLTKLVLSVDSKLFGMDSILVPTLRSLSIKVSSTTDISPSDLVRTFVYKTPKLNSLHLEWLNDDTQHSAETREVLCMMSNLPELRHLSMNLDIFKYPEFLLTLSSLRHLETLSLTTPIVDRTNPPWVFVPCHAFPALHTLRLECPIKMVYAFLPALRGAKISSIHIAIQEPFLPSEQLTLAGSIASNFPSTLESIALQVSEGSVFSILGDFRIILPQSITPLIPAHLTELHLEYMNADDVTDSLCKSMSEAWPRLRSLDIMADRDLPQPPAHMVTLTGLKWFALGCPEINAISMQVNGLGAHWENEIDASLGIMASRLRLLNLQGSSVDSPLSVAKYLRWCFPALRDVCFPKINLIEAREFEIVHACREVCSLLADSRII